MYKGQPLILICGEGGSGKSFVSNIISNNYGLKYNQSTSDLATNMIFEEISSGKWDASTSRRKDAPSEFLFSTWEYQAPQYCYSDRVNHRAFWAWWINDFNKKEAEGIGLYRIALDQGVHILDGIRKVCEFNALRKYCDLAIWLDSPGTPRDPTLEYGPELCDITLQNLKSVSQASPCHVYKKIKNLFSASYPMALKKTQ